MGRGLLWRKNDQGHSISSQLRERLRIKGLWI
jgi:hypothetical protein